MTWAWHTVPPAHTEPTWNGFGVARTDRNPGAVERSHPKPLTDCATHTFHGSCTPAASESLCGSAWSLPNQATATRPGEPTAIVGQMSVWSSGSTRVGGAHVRPRVVEYEYQMPAGRPPPPPSSHAM